ncbi:unknown [Prevotella sp. CAG:891]|nr:unknown [Prevotella sp. CAG:891]
MKFPSIKDLVWAISKWAIKSIVCMAVWRMIIHMILKPNRLSIEIIQAIHKTLNEKHVIIWIVGLANCSLNIVQLPRIIWLFSSMAQWQIPRITKWEMGYFSPMPTNSLSGIYSVLRVRKIAKLQPQAFTTNIRLMTAKHSKRVWLTITIKTITMPYAQMRTTTKYSLRPQFSIMSVSRST